VTARVGFGGGLFRLYWNGVPGGQQVGLSFDRWAVAWRKDFPGHSADGKWTEPASSVL
jgi:hypothetical protein